MKQQFMRGGKWMTLEKAREYDAEQQAEKAPKKLVTLAEQGKAPAVKTEVPAVGEIPQNHPLSAMTLEELKAECKMKEIPFHHASGIKKLQELLNNHVIN